MEKVVDLHDLYWHDSVLKSIHIDTQHKGENDVINLRVKWWDTDVENDVAFQGVYWANLNLNFGFSGNETIYSAELLSDDDEDFQRIKKEIGWKSVYSKLNCYLIKTNSDIKIIAERFVLK